MSPKIRLRFAQSAVAVACVLGTVTPTPAPAQDAAKQTAAKWRPREGIYASPGKGFAKACGEFNDLIVELREKRIGGYEWGCEVKKLTDTGPGAIRIDMICDDYNLALNLGQPEDKKFNEVILLKKMDDKSMLVRKTLDGKFKDPEWKAAYCPKDVQRSLFESRARDRENAKQKAATKSSEPEAPKQ